MTNELRDALIAALEWIDAVPDDTILPAMPGFDRDIVAALIEATKPQAIANQVQGALSEQQIIDALKTSGIPTQSIGVFGLKPALFTRGDISIQHIINVINTLISSHSRQPIGIVIGGDIASIQAATLEQAVQSLEELPCWISMSDAVRAIRALKPEAVDAKDMERHVTLDGRQLLELLDFIAPDRESDPSQLECEATVIYCPADKTPVDDDGERQPAGLYAYDANYPDEGSIPLFDVDAATLAAKGTTS